ncbi:MAG: ADOP family duplicated permease, partial [Longimicrobiales bacterium]
MSRWPFKRSIGPGQVGADDAEAIREEIELYLDLRTDEFIAEGLSPEEARLRAERHFGATEKVEHELRRQAKRRRRNHRTVMTMGGLKQDLAYAFRTFSKNPGFTCVAVLTLGLALGGNTAIFSVVDAALLQAMPFADADELVFLNGTHVVDGESAVRGASYPEYFDWRERSSGVAPMAAVTSFNVAISGDGGAESVGAEMVTRDYFEVLGVEAIVGRTFSPDEHGSAALPGIAVVSDSLWERRFGRADGIIGQDLLLNDRTFKVVGVVPSSFGGVALNTDVWIPESNADLVGFGGIVESRGTRFLTVIGRLTTTPEQAQKEVDVIARDLQAQWPEMHEDRFAQVQPFRDAYLDSTGRLLWILLGAGAVLLLVAAANVANLLLVRAHGRTREIVLRRALGAESGRIVSQLLIESLALALMGGLLGVAFAHVGLRFLAPMIPAGVLPGFVEVQLNVTTFAFSMAVLALVGVFMGLAPAAASTKVDMAGALREGGRNSGGSGRRIGAKQVFVVTQVALALFLLAGAGLLTRSFRAQLGVDTGASLESVVAMRMSLPQARYPDADARRLFAAELQRRASEMPGVVTASISSDLPFRGGSSGAYVFVEPRLDQRIRFHRHSVEPEYLETLGLQLASGRFIEASDGAEVGPVGVITEAMVRRVFPGENPLGKTMYLRPGGDPEFAFEVVGVLRDLRFRDLTTSLMADRNSPDVFFPFVQRPSGRVELAIRVRGEPESFVGPLRALAQGLDADLPVSAIQPLSEAYAVQTATPRFAAYLMGLFSVLAVVLACVGIYGVLTFAVGQRAKEIAIRRAIGASGSSVAARVVADGVKLAAVGLIVGSLAAVLGGRVLESFLFGVRTADPLTLVTVGG